MKHIDSKKNYLKYFLYFIFSIALILRLVYLFKSNVLWWDETIYIGMAKFIFSNGVLGFWENFRPFLLPFVLGFGWFLGFPLILFGKFFQLICSMFIIYLTYYLGEKMYKNAGLIAATIVAFLPVFFTFGNLSLTNIPATALTLGALYFLYRKKYYWCGFFAALALLMRFLFALIAIAIGISILLPYIKTFKCKLKEISVKSFLTLTGFFTLILPFFISNKVLYQDWLYPITEGSRVFNDYNNWLYDLGNIHYIQQIFVQNSLLVFAILGIAAYFILKKWKEPLWNAVLFSFIFMGGYLFHVIHKEVRFMIPVFILMALYAGAGLAWLIYSANKKLNLSEKAISTFLIVILTISMLTGYVTISTNFSQSKLQPTQEIFFNYFENATQKDSLFISSTPMFVVYTDKPMELLGNWDIGMEVYRRHGEDASHIAIDECDKPCEPNSECEVQKKIYLDLMNSKNNLIFNQTYSRWDGQNCSMYIWRK